MNFFQFEESVKTLAKGRAYTVGVRKACYRQESAEWTWQIWIDAGVRIVDGATPEAALDNLKCLLQHEDHKNQTVDPLQENPTPGVEVTREGACETSNQY